MKIGRLTIGRRTFDRHLWKKYLIPRNIVSNHVYFKFYYRWLNFYFCMPLKCGSCGKYLENYSGARIYNREQTKLLITVCRTCKENKVYTNEDGTVTKGYLAWLRDMWEKEEMNNHDS